VGTKRERKRKVRRENGRGEETGRPRK